MSSGSERNRDTVPLKPSGSHTASAVELTLVPGLGGQTLAKIAAEYADLPQVFTLPVRQLEGLGLPTDAAQAVHSRRYRAMAEEIVDWGAREGCHLIVRGSPEYPMMLAEIFSPPMLLYARGNLAALQLPALAVVGTRRPTPYGLQMAEGLSEDLALRGIAVVSGMARGVDAAAHRGCLAAPGPTIAVFGCGIDIVYPREHRRLAQRIMEQGLILSEFPPGTSPSPQNFPVRNRIISGLALGTLIVEASEYSGSLITARLAMEQNREVFAVPGNLTSPQSFGPNFLLKQGAKLVQSWRDIVDELPSELRHSILVREDCRPREAPALGLLTGEENAVLALLETDRARQFDKIYLQSGLEISRLSDLLLSLEMNGWIRQVPGNLYVKVARPHK